MSLNNAEAYSDELKSIIDGIIKEKTNRDEMFEVVSSLSLYVLSNNLEIRTFLFSDQYSYLGSESEKIKGIINSTCDFLFMILDSRDFIDVNVEGLQSDLKEKVFEYLEGKLTDKTLNNENYDSFVSYLQTNYDISIILDILRVRIMDDPEKKEEYKAILEYMIFLGRNSIKGSEFERLQSSINFRLNILKNYNVDYFCKNFFLLKNQIRYLPSDLQEDEFFYPEYILKEMKNLILMFERGEIHSLRIKHKARNIMRRQIQLIEENKKYLNKLKPVMTEVEASTNDTDSAKPSEVKPVV